MGFIRSQERLPHNFFGRMLHAVFKWLGLKSCTQAIHYSDLLI